MYQGPRTEMTDFFATYGHPVPPNYNMADHAIEVLRNGGVIGFPTETVYGLAANALDAAAVEKIFQIKGRPAHNPVIVHVAGLEMARRCVGEWPAAAERLAAVDDFEALIAPIVSADLAQRWRHNTPQLHTV